MLIQPLFLLYVTSNHGYLTGKVTRTYDSEYHQAVRATIETLSSLEIPITEKVADGLKTNIRAERADGTPVSVEVVRIGPGQAEAGVRTGAFGVTELGASDQVHEWIAERLARKSREDAEPDERSGQKTLSEMVEKPPQVSVDPGAAPKKDSSTSIQGLTKRSPQKLTIYFDQDSNDLFKNEVLKLNKIAETLIVQPDLRLTLNGYADPSGPTDYNRMISESRASTVKMYLVGKGVDPLRISVIGHGAKDFVASNASQEGQRQNRRVEIHIGGGK
jgi:outer membrane protein OmpA-like peptidoglycan-associated protein